MYLYMEEFHVRRDIRITEYIEYRPYRVYRVNTIIFGWQTMFLTIGSTSFMTNELSRWSSLVPHKIKFTDP